MEQVRSLLPSGRAWRLVWHDEFDGVELDHSKWDFRLHLLQRRHPGLIGEEGLSFPGDGCVHLNLVRAGDRCYSCQLQTGYNYLDVPGGLSVDHGQSLNGFRWPIAHVRSPLFVHRYGYYEIRCKLQAQPGWWSAFWLQSPIIGASLDPRATGVEVDIMESFTRDGIVSHNNHWGGYGVDHCQDSSGDRQLEETADGFHHFGLEWTPEEYIYYIDGRESWRSRAAVSQIPQFLMVTTECQGYRFGDGPSEELLGGREPDAFVVDFVRVYDPEE